ncbi:MAG: SRPBCC family protein [Burkholderiaceae bacterium]|nr:SRPBCC family protein [Burkholderiaceae bacterium]
MQVEHRIVVAASPEEIFDIYTDVQNWPIWDPDTKRANIDGPFQVGSRGRLTPSKGNTVSIVLTQVVPAKCFTVESRVPLFHLLFEHELAPVPGATEVVHRVTLSGLLSIVLGPILARQLRSGLPVTLRNLKALAEARRAAQQVS